MSADTVTIITGIETREVPRRERDPIRHTTFDPDARMSEAMVQEEDVPLQQFIHRGREYWIALPKAQAELLQLQWDAWREMDRRREEAYRESSRLRRMLVASDRGRIRNARAAHEMHSAGFWTRLRRLFTGIPDLTLREDLGV